jgi:hypothetical protein
MHRTAVLFCLLLICYAYTLPRWADWNQNSRLDLVLAMVDDSTVSIDRYVANTGDYALYRGHTYSDKPPGLSLLALPAYMALSPILDLPPVAERLSRLGRVGALESSLRVEGSGLREDKLRVALVQYLLTLLAVATPAAALGVLFYRLLLCLGAGVLLLLLLPTLWLCWCLVSLGWPRYAFPAVAFGALSVARLPADLMGTLRAGRRPALAWAIIVYAALAIAAPITLSARAVLQPDDSAQHMAAYLNAHVPTDSVVETWEPELGVLTDPPLPLPADHPARHRRAPDVAQRPGPAQRWPERPAAVCGRRLVRRVGRDLCRQHA